MNATMTPRMFRAAASLLGDGEWTDGEEGRLLAGTWVEGLVRKLLAFDLKQVTLDLANDGTTPFSRWLHAQGAPPSMAYVLLKRWVGEDVAFAEAYFAARATKLVERDHDLSREFDTKGRIEQREARLALEAHRLDPERKDVALPHGKPEAAPVGGFTVNVDNRKQVVVNTVELGKRYLAQMGMQRAAIEHDHSDLV